jgi:hypothetical protein
LEKIKHKDQKTFKKEADKTNNSKRQPVKQVRRERRRPCGCGVDVSRNWY